MSIIFSVPKNMLSYYISLCSKKMYSLPFVGITDQTVAVNSHGHQGFGGVNMRAHILIPILDFYIP